MSELMYIQLGWFYTYWWMCRCLGGCEYVWAYMYMSLWMCIFFNGCVFDYLYYLYICICI